MTELLRIIVAIIVAAVIVWLLGGVAGLPSVVVGLVALAAFLVIAFAPGGTLR